MLLVFFGTLTAASSYYIVVGMDLELRPGCKFTDFFVTVSAVLFVFKVVHAINMLFDFDIFSDAWDKALSYSVIFHCITFIIMNNSCTGDGWADKWFMVLLLINIMVSMIIGVIFIGLWW